MQHRGCQRLPSMGDGQAQPRWSDQSRRASPLGGRVIAASRSSTSGGSRLFGRTRQLTCPMRRPRVGSRAVGLLPSRNSLRPKGLIADWIGSGHLPVGVEVGRHGRGDRQDRRGPEVALSMAAGCAEGDPMLRCIRASGEIASRCTGSPAGTSKEALLTSGLASAFSADRIDGWWHR